jgi:diguanylate cyclase (GGDEF)-like protein/PAS domain S-box-containing protein
MAAPDVPSAAGLHALLARQLRRLDIDPGRAVDPAQLGALLERVTRTYEAADQDRYLIERSLEVSSREMGHLYEELRHSSERALASQRDQLRSILDSAAEGIVTTDEHGRVETFNRAAEEMFGWTAAQIDGHDVSELLSGGLATEPVSSLLSRLVDKRGPGSESATLEGRRRNGSKFPIEISASLMRRGAASKYVAIVRDISERVRLQQALEHQAFHDDLTDLANRALLRDRLDHALARSRRTAATVAVLFADLDGFKMINDTLGHDTGDLLLAEVGQRLRHSVRDGDTAARLGGDEFAVLLDESSPQDAAATAYRILDSLREPFAVEGREIFVRASIGVADNHEDALDADELLCRADIAMYAAKARGRDRHEVFERHMQAELASRHEMQSDLRQALHDDQLVLHYQPLVDLATGRIDSFEALIRWNHPTRGLVAPDDFIPIAEESGLIIPIGRWVLRAACGQLVQWRAGRPADDPLSIGVNVSSQQLHDPNFVADVQEVLSATRLRAEYLVLELTESTLLSDTTLVQERLHALKDLGVRLAIDDFGTGYSSLAYLRTFPVDYLKIDRTFVNEVSRKPDQGIVMVRSIIGLGHNLSLTVIAEGIEELAQLEQLRAAGCNIGQGFLFARPVPPDQVPDLLAQPTPRADVAPAESNGANPDRVSAR